MRLQKLTLAFLAVMALGVMAVSTAAAETDPVFLFKGQTGTVSEGKGTLSTLTQFFELTCESAAGSVTAANDSNTFTGEIEFKKCTGTGLGQASGVIKFKFKGLTCLTGKETELKPCAYIEATESVHIEVPIIGLITFLSGSSQACALSEDGKSVTSLTMKCEKGAGTGDQALTSVKDLGVALSPKINVLEGEKTETMGAIASTFKITFKEAGTLDG